MGESQIVQKRDRGESKHEWLREGRKDFFFSTDERRKNK